MFYMTFNDISNEDLGVKVTTRPDIPAPTLRGEYIDIAGRDGSLFQSDGTYENIEISVALNYVRPQNNVGDMFRRLKAWINGSGVLRFSDDTDIFYKVKYSGISANARRTYFGAELTATFICDPFQYYNSGTAEIEPSGTLLNPYYLAKPIYKILGSGTATLTVNGNEFVSNFSGNIIIDTDLMIAYSENGTLLNANTSGDYDGLYLLPGDNAISVSSGYTLKVTPNFRSL